MRRSKYYGNNTMSWLLWPFGFGISRRIIWWAHIVFIFMWLSVRLPFCFYLNYSVMCRLLIYRLVVFFFLLFNARWFPLPVCRCFGLQLSVDAVCAATFFTLTHNQPLARWMIVCACARWLFLFQRFIISVLYFFYSSLDVIYRSPSPDNFSKVWSN